MSFKSTLRRSAFERGKQTPAAAPVASTTNPETRSDAHFAAAAQLAYLEAAVSDWPSSPRHEPLAPDAEDKSSAPSKIPAFLAQVRTLRPMTVLKSAIAIAVAVAFGWVPAQRLIATTSAEAIVNARIVTIRAPIEGEVTMAKAGTDIGTAFRADENILTIRNSRADFSHLLGMARDRDQLRTSIAALEAKKQLLTSTLGELDAQQERFRIGRIAQIEQRVNEADADIASAEAQYSVASDALSRATHLRTTDAVSQAALDKARGDAKVAEQAIRAQVERKKGILVELDAARKGSYIGDSYNDTPQSAQRRMEISLELSDVEARLAGNQRELAAMETTIGPEQTRQADLSRADIPATINGRVWEMLTAPGEHVNAGQDLMKLLDCGSAIVTASVSETVYERLFLGQSATFRPRDGGPELKGAVVGLNGLAIVDSNSAIQQNALSREPYHVSLKFPGLSNNLDCRVGRSGLVKFETGAASSTASNF